MNIAFMTDWFFDPLYEENLKKDIANQLEDSVFDWMGRSYVQLRDHLEKRPGQKIATTAEASKGTLEDGSAFQSLFLLSIERGELTPSQCQVFIGSTPYISKKIEALKDYTEVIKRQKSGSAFVREEEL
jgi:hypothetical protein